MKFDFELFYRLFQNISDYFSIIDYCWHFWLLQIILGYFHFKRFQIIIDYFRLFIIISDYFLFFLIISHYFRLFQIISYYFRLFQTINEYFWTFCDIFYEIYLDFCFENIKFTLEAEVLSTFCSCHVKASGYIIN